MASTNKFKQMAKLCGLGFGVFSAICIYKEDTQFYKKFIMPAVHLLDPEQAHRFSVMINKYRLLPKSKYSDPQSLKVQAFGRIFSNPVGIAAGYDKNAEAILGLKDMGFGFVEIGSVTPLPQEGNEKPRVFRLKNDKAVINRYGFNSDGHEKVLQRIYELRESNFDGIIGINLGKNKTSPNPIGDYVKGIIRFGPVADYIVINISSPNTPGLRNMQGKKELHDLLVPVVEAVRKVPNRPALLLKLAPDLSYEERKDVAEVISKKECRVDGLIVSNTTISRPDTLNCKEEAKQTGGLSGKPLKELSTEMVADMYKLTKGMPIIGVGGISSGQDAYEKIKAGATVVQIYTALVYEGPTLVSEIKKELVSLLAKDGYKTIGEAVGKSSSS
ncbi:dihydroorotate dehydrogenase (quinone), mitochondrial [Coccinella septempunctata]|uniref:dihydroorotate dehydrogenase (quinone), mitochondrial n=1 Tax=Coccinella septempunctata TaxID=41139 RepID=UPI001D08DF1E|nr:dihydroorotate dehydrogenase (quinone), mitochondrial [Coccinella septempunctata]